MGYDDGEDSNDVEGRSVDDGPVSKKMKQQRDEATWCNYC
jgi:hypothetical protein